MNVPSATTDKNTHAVPRSTNDHCWQSYQLLPDLYVRDRSARRVLRLWAVGNTTLLVLLIGYATFLWAKGNQIQKQNDQLIARSIPVREVRDASTRLKQDSQRYENWTDAINSAKPDDSVLQTLLAVAHSTGRSSDSAPSVSVKSIVIDLPTEAEHDDRNKQPKRSLLSITGTLSNTNNQDTIARRWLKAWQQRLGSSQRAEQAKLYATDNDDGSIEFQITAHPVATKVVP